MQIWIHDNKMKKITALNNDVPDMLSYTNSTWHSYLDQATSTFDFTIPKFSNGELHEDLKLINDECFVSFYVNGSYQVFYIATLQEDDFNIQLTCNNTNLEYALEYANPFNSSSAQSIQWYLEHMDLLSFAAVEIGNNEIPDRKRTLTFDSQETKMNRLQSLMSKFEAEFEFKVELNRDGTYKRIVINIYQEADDTHHGIGTDRKDVVLYYSNGLKGVQVTSDKTQMFNAGVFDGKDGVNLANVEFSEKNADGVEEFYSRKGDIFVYAPLSMQRYPATMKPNGQDNWIRKDFQTEYENVNDLKAYALRTLKQYAYPLVTYTASVQSGFVSHYTDLKLGDTIRIIDKNFVGGLALEARVSEMIISFDNPANNSFVFTNYRKLDNKPSSALQTRIEQVIESRLSYRIELATTGGVTFKNNEGETIIKPSLYKGNLPWTKDVTWHWTLNSIVTDGMQYRIQARDITDTAVLTVDAFVGGKKVATTEITLTNINDGLQGPQGPQGDEGPKGPQGDEGPKGDKGDTGNGIANTVVTYGLSMSDTTEPATWSSSVPTLVQGMYLWTRTVYVYTNGESTTSYQISYIAKDADATAAIDKTKQELIEKLETVRNDSLAAAEEAKQQLTAVANDLSTAKQDLQEQASQLTEQANAQSELTKRVSSVEETANGTKTTVSELTKTVAQNGKDITSVTNRTKTVEDDLANTKTTLTQVQTTANSASQKTATLETGLNGLTAKFENLSVGTTNHFLDSAFETTIQKIGIFQNGDVYTPSIDTTEKYYGYNTLKIVCKDSAGVDNPKITYQALAKLKTVQQGKLPDVVTISFWGKSNTEGMVLYTRLGFTNYESSQNVTLTTDWKRYIVHVRTSSAATNEWLFKFSKAGTVWIAKPQFEFSAIASDYHSAEEDTSSKIAEYKQTADQNYASLSSTVQTLDGTVKQNKSEFDQTTSQLKTTISAVEGKIPTDVSTRNLILKSNDFVNPHKQNGANTTVTSTDGYFVIKSTGYTANAWGGMSWNMSISEVKAGEEFSILMPVYIDSSIALDSAFSFELKRHNPNTRAYAYSIQTNKKDQWFNVAITFKASNDVVFDTYPFYVYIVKNGLVRIKPPMLVRGNLIPSDYQPAFEDTKSDVTKLNTTLTQTANGLQQLSTQVTSQGSTIISHTNSINSLTTGLQAKVSQSDFNTLSGRVTTAENNITAKANELSSKISSVEGKLPSGEINLVEYGRPADGYSPYRGAEYTTHGFYYNGAYKMYIIRNTATNEKLFGMNRFKVERNTDYTLYFKGFNNGSITNMDVWFLKRVNGSKNDWDSAQQLVAGRKFSVSRAEDVSVTFNTGNYDEGYLRFDNNGTRTSGTSADLYFGDVSVKKGKSNNGWSPSLAELASSQALKSAQSEFKQTTDSIKASVQSLDNNTVKNSSLTINADGIVMKAGKSTTDVANAIGSYFAVNQNAINLFSDKIKVKGNMIVSGSISSDKISSSGITANVIKGGTLQSTNGSTNFELNTGKLFYNNNNTGVFRVQNGASTMGLKFSNTPITVNGTSRILSRAILGGDRRESTLDDGKWDKGGFSGLVIETIKGAVPAVNEHADSLRAISDTIYFTHTYSADSPTGVSAHGWKMETYAPDSSYSGNIVLKPYGINYRQSDIVVGDVRLDNGDGSGYWMRATINTLKACFGHILNGGTSSQALNAIRSELNKISGT